MKKRLLSLVLVLCMAMGLMGIPDANTRVLAATRSDALSEQEKELHDYITNFVNKVATGKKASSVLQVPWSVILGVDSNELTAAELGVSSLMDGSSISKEANKAVNDLMNIDMNPIVDAILADNVADMFWYDKTRGMSWGAGGSISFTPDKVTLPEDGYKISFYVSADYSKSGSAGTTQVDKKKTAAARKTVKKAKQIVKKAAGKSDYEKLYYYAKQICKLTSYDKKSYSSGSTPYGNPWQYVNVFDNDKSTNVVCEGYSKAFKLLCDLTEFDSPLVECKLVSGAMSGGTGTGSHMWNLVTMDDGLTYMADITNCDDGSVGWGLQLFLKGCETRTSSGYSIYIPERTKGNKIYFDATVSYVYSDQTKEQYTEEELTIAEADYEP